MRPVIAIRSLVRKSWKGALVAAVALYVTGPQVVTDQTVYHDVELDLTTPHVRLFTVSDLGNRWELLGFAMLPDRTRGRLVR
jgi:hypothetical protein